MKTQMKDQMPPDCFQLDKDYISHILETDTENTGLVLRAARVSFRAGPDRARCKSGPAASECTHASLFMIAYLPPGQGASLRVIGGTDGRKRAEDSGRENQERAENISVCMPNIRVSLESC